MKEVMAIVRLNKVNQTKEALANAGIPAFTCRKVLGRGAKSIDLSVIQAIIEEGTVPTSSIGESMTESSRLIPKRVFTFMVADDQIDKVITTLIDVNSTGNAGDGKIFVLPIMESYNVRNGELDGDSY